MHPLKKKTRKQNFSQYTEIDKGQLYFSEYPFYHFMTSSLVKLKKMIFGSESLKSQAPVDQIMKKNNIYMPKKMKCHLPCLTQSFKENLSMIQKGLQPYCLSHRRWAIIQKKDKLDRQDILDSALQRRKLAQLDQDLKQQETKKKKIKTQLIYEQFWKSVTKNQQKIVEDLKRYCEEQRKKEQQKAAIKTKDIQNKRKEQKKQLVQMLIKQTQNDLNLSPIGTQSSVTDCSEINISTCLKNISQINQQRQENYSQVQKGKFQYSFDQDKAKKTIGETKLDDVQDNKVFGGNYVPKNLQDNKDLVKKIDVNPFKIESNANAKPIKLMQFINKNKKEELPFLFSSSSANLTANQPSFQYANTQNNNQDTYNHYHNYQSTSNPYQNTQISNYSSNPLYQQPKYSMFQKFCKPQNQFTPSFTQNNTVDGGQQTKNVPRISYLDNFMKDNRGGDIFSRNPHPTGSSRLFDDDSTKKTQRKFNVSSTKRRGKQKEIRIYG